MPLNLIHILKMHQSNVLYQKYLAGPRSDIWVADMCLVGIRTINVKKSTKNSTTSYLKVGSYFDSQTSATCLSINFNF